MRVAMLSVHTSPLEQPGTGDAGGMNVYVLELAQALGRMGVAVEIFTRATSSHQLPTVQVSDNVLVHQVFAGPFEGLSKEDLPGQLCAFIGEVLRMETRRPPGWFDVLHTHYWLSGQVGWMVADRWKIPLVHSMHTMARVKNASLAPGDAPEPLGRILGEEQVVEVADALVASTRDEAQALIAQYSAQSDKVCVIAPGVDLQVFTGIPQVQARAQLGLDPQRQLLLFAGRVQRLKGPDVVVRAMQALPDTVDLVVLGGASGSTTAVRELQALAYQCQVSDRVRVLPPVSREELAVWFSASDLVTVPSYSESFGMVAAEAGACGVPVVAAAVGGLRTVVDHGRTGILVDSHDEGVWAQVLGDLLADAPRRELLAQGAAAARYRFGWEATAQQMLRVYTQAIARCTTKA